MSIQAVIAVNRFGLGAKSGDIDNATKSPKKWLISQLTYPTFDLFGENELTSNEIALKLATFRKMRKELEKSSKTANQNEMMASMSESDEQKQIKDAKKYPQWVYRELCADALARSINSDQSLQWRLLDFFSNHFSVTAQGPVMSALAPTLEREAIAPNLLGNFESMLLAVCKHPAMLLYLNNEKSFGPQSILGKRGKGLNENLAREILELHTLGVNGGYSQQDVTELAKGITGWSVINPLKEKAQGFIFRNKGHEPGKRTLLNKKFSMTGVSQGEQMLKHVAHHPSTAIYICTKLARHFVQDEPTASLINSLTSRWKETNGNIKEVIIALINSNESWHENSLKFKTPREFLISTMRAAAPNTIKDKQLLYALYELGQKPFSAGSPAGFSDIEQGWNGASALMARIDLSSQFAAKRQFNAEKMMNNSFGKFVSQRTYNMVLRAESRQHSATLLLMSPEFQRR